MVESILSWPKGIGRPAQRALEAAGYREPAQLDGIAMADLAGLHGMGPKGLRILQDALQQRDMSLT